MHHKCIGGENNHADEDTHDGRGKYAMVDVDDCVIEWCGGGVVSEETEDDLKS